MVMESYQELKYLRFDSEVRRTAVDSNERL